MAPLLLGDRPTYVGRLEMGEECRWISTHWELHLLLTAAAALQAQDAEEELDELGDDERYTYYDERALANCFGSRH